MRLLLLFLLLTFSLSTFCQNTITDPIPGIDVLMARAIEQNPSNNPQEALDYFTYSSYGKIVVTDSLSGNDDSPHSFFSEQVAQNTYAGQRDIKEEVEGIRMAGFDEPRYEILGTTIESRTFYDEDFVILNYRYAGVLSARGLKHYNYTFLGDTLIDDRPSYIIGLRPKRPEAVPGLTGKIWLDQQSLALQQVRIELDDEIKVQIAQNYRYFPEQQVYMPVSNIMLLEKGKTGRRLGLFKGKISIGTIQEQPVKDAIEGKYLVSTQFNRDFAFAKVAALKNPNLAIEIMPGATEQPESFWQKNRPDALTVGDMKSFDYLEKVVDTDNIERRLGVINNFGIGYYTINFFDFDLTYPVKLNNYEGLRLGVGGVTNATFSERFRLEGYLAYGFKDSAFKFGLGGGVLLDKSHGAWLSLNYSDDLQEVGSYNYLTDRRVYSLFEPRLVNISQFFDHTTFRINQEFRATPQLLTEFQFSRVTVDPLIEYRFVNDGKAYDDYTVTEATLSARWSPSSKYMRTKVGTSEIYEGFPIVSTQVSKGISGVLGSDFNFTKVAAKLFYQVERLNKSTTQFLVEGKAAFGDLPLTHVYHAFPNSPNKETVFQRFSVAGINSFETMYFGEFFSDRLATLEVKHRLRPFELTDKWRPEMVFITRYAIGDLRDPQDHLDVDFKSLKHGYTETGFEINKIVFGFGTSLTYRYGAYHLPKFSDNIAFKFTFNLKL